MYFLLLRCFFWVVCVFMVVVDFDVVFCVCFLILWWIYFCLYDFMWFWGFMVGRYCFWVFGGSLYCCCYFSLFEIFGMWLCLVFLFFGGSYDFVGCVFLCILINEICYFCYFVLMLILCLVFVVFFWVVKFVELVFFF